MNYTVTYKPSAETELIDLWTIVPRRQAVADAANRLDQLLGAAPNELGESRDGRTRIHFERPLAVQFQVDDGDRVVEVVRVWWIGHGRAGGN